MRKINAVTHIITTVAGNGTSISGGDGGPATAAGLIPQGIAVNDFGYIYIVDNNSANVRVVDTFGIIHTGVGTGTGGYNGDGGWSDTSQIYNPYGIALDSCGNAFICDNGNGRIRKVTFTVTDTPTIFITASADTACSGTSVMFSASSSGGGSYISYQWFADTTAISGATSSSYTYSPILSDSVRCRIATWNRCSSVSYATSNTIHMVVTPLITPTITVTASPNDTVCAGTTVTYNAVVTGTTGGAYQWLVNGVAAGSGATSYSYSPTTGDRVQCVFTGSAACLSAAHDTSNVVHMVVNPAITPTVTITASPNDTVCAGTTVSYTALVTGTSGGAYQWLVNSTPAGSGATSYSYTPITGDRVQCVFTGSGACLSAAHDTSNIVRMVVNPLTTPTVTITPSPNDTVCAGTTVTYNAVVTGTTGGAYQWLVNGTAVGSGATSYRYTPIAGDRVQCVFTGSAACLSAAHDTSNMVRMIVNPAITPTVTITPSPNDTVCAGTTVSYSVAVTGTTGGAYQWLVNGTPAGSGATSYSYTPTTGDRVQCVFTGSGACLSAARDTSNSIRMVVDSMGRPTLTLTGPVGWPPGGVVIINAGVTGAMGTYTIYWYINGVLFTTTTTPTLGFTKSVGFDTVTAVIVSDNPCVDSAFSNVHIVSPKSAGIGVFEGGNSITLWPNPVNGTLHIGGLSAEGSTITLYDLLGRELLRSEATGSTGEVNLSGLVSGVYMVQVCDMGSGVRVVSRVRVE